MQVATTEDGSATDRPTVSVVIATYNRSQVLRHAIASVVRSTLADWELIVIGDHCTDDTADVVAAFDDRRITFENLPVNCGEQSAPNNAGVARARGRYVAFLNHDDAYFPDHLESAARRLESSGADLVWVPYLVPDPIPPEPASAAPGFSIRGVPPHGVYDPMVFSFASSWVLTRELAHRVGPWRSAHDVVVTPSQDWLFRAWRAGARIEFHDHVSVMALPGGARRGSYLRRSSPEHEAYAPRLGDRDFRTMALEAAAVDAARTVARWRYRVPVKRVLARALSPLVRVCVRLGIHPWTLHSRTGRKAAFVNRIRRAQGLGDLPPP